MGALAYEPEIKNSPLLSHNSLDKIAEEIGITERRSQLAEWEAKDRIITRFYTDYVGNEFEARVASVQSFGMYVSIENGIAEGLLPARTMKDDYYIHDQKSATLTGRKNKKVYKVGTVLQVKLLEADIISGRLTFGLAGVDDTSNDKGNKPPRRNNNKKPFKKPSDGYKGKGTKKPRRP